MFKPLHFKHKAKRVFYSCRSARAKVARIPPGAKAARAIVVHTRSPPIAKGLIKRKKRSTTLVVARAKARAAAVTKVQKAVVRMQAAVAKRTRAKATPYQNLEKAKAAYSILTTEC